MVDQKTLDDIIARIVDVVEPEKIIIFGSTARGSAGRHSDVDLLSSRTAAIRWTSRPKSMGGCTGSAPRSMPLWSLPPTSSDSGIATPS
jgi:hypothetical protein